MPNNLLASSEPKVRRGKRYGMIDLPIRYKLIVYFLLISILPSMILGGLIGWTVDRMINKQVIDNTQQLISKVNNTLEFYVGNLQNITYFAAFNPDIQQFLDHGEQKDAALSGGDYGIHRYLQGFTTLYSEVAGILIVNSRGEYISNEMVARYDGNLTEETWYQEAVANRGIFKIIGHPTRRIVTTHVRYKDSEVVSVVRAILDPDTQQVKGVVLIDLKLRVIAEAAKDVRLGKTGYLMVIDDKGENIYSPTQPFISQIPKPWLKGSSKGTFSKKIGGSNFQFVYRKSPFTNWTTIGVFRARDTVMELQWVRFYVISFIFVVFLLGIATTIYLSYSFSRPLRQLMSFMRIAESGDLNIRYREDRADEFGLLGHSFNHMLVQMNRLITLTELQERQKREAELRSLQAHIKPHFLYNTLDTIQWLARSQGAVDAAEGVEALSRLFRIGLSKGKDLIPFGKEAEHIRSYLQIQKMRYRDKLNYTLDIPENLENLSVLKIMLQPIVENAIYHGIKERRGPGHIHIAACAVENGLLIQVQDDGKGMPPERLAMLNRRLTGIDIPRGNESGDLFETAGYGLVNVQARLKLMFGEPYGIRMESRLGEGTTVTLLHPIIEGGLSGASPEEK